MGGPCKNIKTGVSNPDDKCGRHANPRKRSHPRTMKLEQRIAGFERCEKTSKTTIHKPGSQNGHK